MNQYATQICVHLSAVSTSLFICRPRVSSETHRAKKYVYSTEMLDSGNKSVNEVDGTYEVERAHMTGCAVTENTLTKLLEQLIINENLRALNAHSIRP